MLTLHCDISEALADELEALLCELPLSPWSLHQAKPGELFRLKGFFELKSEGQSAYFALRVECPALPEVPQYGSIDELEWKLAYQAFLKPWHDRGLHWVPVWERATYSLPPDDVAVYLDTGLAFGTGSHETTRLMARRLLDFRRERAGRFASQVIIDAGCGSGILAISAYQLGATYVAGFDRDPEAIRVSCENSLLNELPINAIAFEVGGIEERLAGKTADLILANIQADVLRAHANAFVESIREGGCLALCGILERELEPVRQYFEKITTTRWARMRSDARVDGDWADLALFRS